MPPQSGPLLKGGLMSRRFQVRRSSVVVAAFLTGLSASLTAAESAQDLTGLDLTTLMNMDVKITSAAKRSQPSSDAAAAVFVLTREDIHRSGATSVPELLRMVPGVEVARVSNTRWAITTRGFNSRFANKLLVLVDGRSIYTSIYSGVSWEEQHIPLPEIERIEVVRGPGGSLWGANAMNGVINIVTREASDSRGFVMSGGAGDSEHSATSVRFGGTEPSGGDYRVYAEHFERDSFTSGTSPWRSLQTGWRWDRAAGPGELTFQGDLRDNNFGEFIYGAQSFDDVDVSSATVSLGWQGKLPGGELDVRAGGHWRDSRKYGIASNEKQRSFGLDAQYTAARWGRHLLSFGAEWKQLEDRVLGYPGIVVFVPPELSQKVWGFSVQDEVFFRDDTVRLIFGTKIEGFEFTDTAVQPTVRAIWHANERNTLWAAVSRAVRTPSYFERYMHLWLLTIPGAPGEPSQSVEVFGSPQLDEEQLDAFELGWRWRPAERLSIDVALYANDYHDLIETRAAAPFPDPGPPAVIVLPSVYQNSVHANTRGAEIATDWIVTDRLRLQFGATLYDMRDLRSPDALFAFADVDPTHTFTARARLDLPRRTELDIGWRRVGAIRYHGIDAYDSTDLRFGWHVNDELQFSVAIDNVFNSRHAEYFNEESAIQGDVFGRSVFARISWQKGF